MRGRAPRAEAVGGSRRPARAPAVALPGAVSGALACCLPEPVLAHASEQALVLLLPTDVYVAAGTAAVALTALLVYAVPAPVLERAFARRAVPVALRDDGAARVAPASLAAALALAALLYAGLAGPRDPLANPLPLAIWTLFWIALPLLHAALGNLWPWMNPWSGPLRLLTGRTAASPGPATLPAALGAWPAVVLFLAATAFALADPAPADPERLAATVAAYWALNLAAAWAFGEREWFARGEGFSLLFGRFAELAPAARTARGLALGAPGHRLVHGAAPSLSLAVGCLALLAAGSFDGLHGTFRWLLLVGANPLEHPGRSALAASTVAGLAALTLAIVLAFLGAAALGAALARDRTGATDPEASPSTGTLFRALAPSVLPIAVAYHFAHYLTGFMVDAQYAWAVASDPLGTGRDLLGTAGRPVTTGFLNTPASVRAIWLSQAGAVTLGHALAVLVAHARAHDACAGLPDAGRRARLAHLPLVALMLGYTLFGLWLLAAPRAS